MDKKPVDRIDAPVNGPGVGVSVGLSVGVKVGGTGDGCPLAGMVIVGGSVAVSVGFMATVAAGADVWVGGTACGWALLQAANIRLSTNSHSMFLCTPTSTALLN